jgi:hypothetical protein
MPFPFMRSLIKQSQLQILRTLMEASFVHSKFDPSYYTALKILIYSENLSPKNSNLMEFISGYSTIQITISTLIAYQSQCIVSMDSI